jgi:hypothetical protein
LNAVAAEAVIPPHLRGAGEDRGLDLLGDSVPLRGVEPLARFDAHDLPAAEGEHDNIPKPRPSGELMLPSWPLRIPQLDMGFTSLNENYWQEKQQYVLISEFVKPLSFVVRNSSCVVAEDVRIDLAIRHPEEVTVLSEEDYPEEPAYYNDPLVSANFFRQPESDVLVRRFENRYLIQARVGKVQPGKERWCSSVFYIGSRKDRLNVEAIISADNLPAPQRVPLTIKFTTQERELDYGELRPPPLAPE